MLLITDEIKKTYPGGCIGVLAVSQVSTPDSYPSLDQEKEELEQALRTRYRGYQRTDLAVLEPLNTYISYYKKFNKTYHVLHQLESIVFKNKSIPRVAALVEAMFMSELKHLLLTAGHDLDTVQLPLKVDAAQGNESYTTLSGQEKILLPNDMVISDEAGVISSIIYGPDGRTSINRSTENAVFTVYAPPGIREPLITRHLDEIQRYIMLISPESKVRHKHIYRIT